MELNEESKSAIEEIGNLTIAGGSNRISNYSDEIVDISVVELDIHDTQELLMKINPYDDCNIILGLPVKGQVEGKFIVQISTELMNNLIGKFNKLETVKAGKDAIESSKELFHEFFLGCIDGIAGMTGIEIMPDGETKVIEDLSIDHLPDQVMCYNSIIYIGDERLDYNVFFFADPQKIIPHVLEALGL